MANSSYSNEELIELRRRLRSRRLFLNLTYKQLADKTGMSKSTLQRYETGGIKSLPFDKMPVLSEALEVPIRYFTDLGLDHTIILEELEKDNATSNNSQNKIESLETRKNIANQGVEFHQLALNHITPLLLRDGYTYTVNPDDTFGDIVATKGKERWYIEVKYVRNSGDSFIHPTIIPTFYKLMGQLATSRKRITKYSILYNIDGIGDKLIKKFSARYLNVDVSLLYLTEDGYREVFFDK